MLVHTSVEELIDFWSGVSHGTFSVSDIESKKLIKFKQTHEKKLACDPINLDTLCVVVKK